MLFYSYSVFYFFVWVTLIILRVLVTPWVWLFTGELTTAPHLEIEKSKDFEKHFVGWGDGLWLSRRVTWEDL